MYDCDSDPRRLEELEAAVAAARSVAHDLANRLTLLTGYSSLLQSGADPATAEVAELLLMAAEEVGKDVDRLRDLLRPPRDMTV